MKKAFHILIFLLVLVICMASCEIDEEHITKTDKRFTAEKVFPEDFSFLVSNSFVSEDSMYFNGACLDEPDISSLWRFEMENGVLTQRKLSRDKTKFPGENIVMCYMDSGRIDEEDNYSILTMSYGGEDDENRQYFMYKYDCNGTLFQVNDLTQGIRGFFEGLTMNYPMNVMILQEGILFTYSEIPLVSDVVFMSLEGKVFFDTRLDGYAQDIKVSEDGNILVLEEDFGKSVASLIEINSQTGKKKTLIKEIKHTEACLFANGINPEWIYYLTDEGLMQCDRQGKNICEVFKLSDVNVSSALDIKAIAQISNGEWMAFINTGERTERELFFKYNFFKIREAHDDVMTEMILALTDADQTQISACRDAAVLYNKTHDRVRIVVNCYDTIDELAKEITAGKIPDMIDISNSSLGNSLEEKGLLVDLNDFLKEDVELSCDDFLKKSLEIYNRDGKLRAIPDRISIMALIGNKDYLNDWDGWSFEEYRSFMNSLPNAEVSGKYIVREDFLQYVCPFLLGHFVDASNGTCCFETQEFYELLELVKKCSDSKYGQMDFESFYDEVHNGEFRIIMAGIAEVQDYELLMSMYSHNGKIIGFPADDRNGIYIVPEGCAIAISGACHEKEMAWDFVKDFLVREDFGAGGIPTYLNRYEEMLQTAYDQMDNKEMQMQIAYGNIELDIPYASKEDIDAFEKLIENGDALSAENDEIMQIILEETESFFKGFDTAKKAAMRIQKRVQLYLDE